MSSFYLSIFFNGLAIGAAYFLAAAGLTVLFGILRILNFAHGSFIMIGAYLANTILSRLGSYGLVEFMLVGMGVAAVVGVLGLIVDRLVFRRLHGVDEAVALIATFALMLVVNGATEMIWGSDFVSVNTPTGLDGALFLGPVILPTYAVFLVCVAALVFLLIDLFLQRSWLGKTLQAVAEDRWIMSILGQNPRRLEILAVFIAFALAGFAGAMIGPNQVLDPNLGNHVIIQAFAVVIVGGLGSIRGAFMAAMLLGLAESFGSLYIPSLSLYFGMILILILRPQGLIAPKLSLPQGNWSFGWLWQGIGWRSFASAPRSATMPALPAAPHAPSFSLPHIALLAVLAAVMLSLPAWTGAGIIYVVSLFLISSIFAMSWNLMFGYSGIATFGHAAFFAIGAYLSGYLLKANPETSFLLILVGAFLLGALAAAPVGIITLRRATGVQLAILTLAVAEVLRVLISYSGDLGRDEGLSAIVRPHLGIGPWSIPLVSDTSYYLFLCIATGLVLWLVWMLSHSSFGRTLRSIRQDAQRARFLGINVDRFRLISFMLAGAIAAVAGALTAPLSQIVTPEAAAISRSTEPMLHTLLGGAGTFWGPVVGSAIFAAIDYSTRALAGLSELIMGVTLLIVVLIAPGGVFGFLMTTWWGLSRRKARPEPLAKVLGETP